MESDTGGETKESIFRAGPRFLKESVEELKKVTTPSKQETITATWVTLLIMVTVAVVLSIMDLIFRNIMGALVG